MTIYMKCSRVTFIHQRAHRYRVPLFSLCLLMKMSRVIIIVLSITLIYTSPVIAKSFWNRFKDPSDGKFDVSGWSEEEEAITGGFLPIPIIESEPAIGGLALGVGLLYIREKSWTKDTDSQTGKPGKETRKRPPVISGIAGAYSLNDSWLIGFGHQDNWLNDSFRYSGGLGYGSLNLDFYGIGQNALSGDSSIRFNIESLILLQDLKYRLFKSDFFLGARYLFLNTESVFDGSDIIPGIPPEQFDSKDGGLGPVLQYDTRDNIFTPTRGSLVDISAMFYDSTFGGDFTYQKYKVGGFTWLPVHKKVTLGLRLEGSLADGDTPFYAVSFIKLRGIPALRYQDDVAVMGEVEARWQAFSRWSILGFVGSGRVAESFSDLDKATSRNTFGAGFRYLIARKFGLHSGIDIARGPEETYAYIQIGSAW